MAIQIFSSAGGTASFNGIFVPRADLAPGGLSADTELDAGVAANIKRDKALYALTYVVASTVSSLAALDALGISAAVPTLSSISHTTTLTVQRYVKESSDAKLAPIPVPATGANLGRGDIAFTDVFPNATKIANAGAVAGAGVLIEAAPLVSYGAADYATLNLGTDSRQVFYAMFKDMATDSTNYPTRSATEASAVTARAVGTSTEVALAPALIDATDPTSGLAPAEANITHILSSGAMGLTFNIVASLAPTGEQTWEVNSVTL